MEQNQQTNCPCAPCAGRFCPMMCSNAIKVAKERVATANELIKEELLRVRMAASILLELKNANRHRPLYGELNTAYQMLHCLEILIEGNGGAL